MITSAKKNEKPFYPDYGRGKGIYIICLCLSIVFFYLWIANKSIILLFPGILFLLPIGIMIWGNFFIGIKKIEIEQGKIVLFYPKEIIELKAGNLYEILIREDGICSYKFIKNAVPIRITPLAYKNGERLLREFEQLAKKREKDIKIDDRRKTSASKKLD